MNQNAEKLGRVLLEADFQLGLNVVHTGEGKIIRQRAMTRKIHAAADALEDEIVNVENFGKLRGHRLQAVFKFGVADQFFGLSMVAGSLSIWVRISAISGIRGACRLRVR